MNDAKLTSVKILKSLYDNFKLKTVNTKMTLQKITNRSIEMYLNNQQFQEDIEKNNNLTVSGSNF